MGELIKKYYLYFMLYAIIGWIYEVFLEVVVYKWGFTNRGVLFGPYCPVYGVGALAFIFTIGRILPGKSLKMKLMLIVAIVAFSVFEMTCNTHLLMNYICQREIDKDYIEYDTQGEVQISNIKSLDDSLYRISQTSTRNVSGINLMANYDEAAHFNYWSIEMYTSVPDDIQREFLNKAGYRINGEDMHIVNTSILPIDSLLGVKYVLSKYPITGLEPIESLGVYNEKTTYYNILDTQILSVRVIQSKESYKNKENIPH